jgi:phosphoglucosamine mutase
MVDAQGRLYNGDELLFAVVRERAMRGPVSGVAGTLMSNLGLEQAFQTLDIPFARTAVGDRYVVEKLLQNKWLYGGESSGHLLCLDCHTTGDGIVAGLQVLAALMRHQTTLSDWVKDLTLYPQVMINVPIAPGMDWQAHEPLKRAQTEVESSLKDKGRVLIRASGTEPKLRLMVEAPDANLAAKMAQTLASALA